MSYPGEDELRDPRNILMFSVPHSGSSVLSHLVSCLGNQHHGTAEADVDGWRRGEFDKVNKPCVKVLQSLDEGDGAKKAEGLRELEEFVSGLRQPWIIKNIHLTVVLLETEHVWAKFNPHLVLIERSVDQVAESFASRSQTLADRGGLKICNDGVKRLWPGGRIPGMWNRTVADIAESAIRVYNSWGGRDVSRISFEAFSYFVKNENWKAIRKILSFAEPFDDETLIEACSVFDPSRPKGSHPRKGSSGW